jgi:Ca2+-binding RTX toxin-like protein
VAPKWKSSIPIAGVAAVAAMAFPGIANATVTPTVAGTELTVTSDAADPIAIAASGANVTVNGANVAGANPATLTKITVTGGPGANAITLAGVTKVAFPAVTAVTVDGGAGTDDITGSELNDRILGGTNDPGTRDTANGGPGDDTLVWNPGQGDDINNGDAGTDTIEVNGGGGGEQFTVKPSATPGRVAFDRTGPTPPGPFNLDIGTAERLDLNANGGDDSLVSDAGLDALGFKLDIAGGDGNDTLDGGDGADLIAGDAGNDTITLDDNPLNTRDIAQGGDGDDTMIWNGGDDDDVNDGGAGNDTVTVNGAPVAEAFTLNASPTPGHATFDRAATPGPGPFNIDIVASERLDMNLNGGDDTFASDGAIAALGLKADVEGADGNDTIDGTDAADLLDGGGGNDRIVPDDNPAGTRDDARGGDGDDTIVWNGGDDDDLNEGGAGNDTSEVNGAAADERFTINPSPTAGRVLFDRLATPGPGPFNVDIGTTETLHLLANAGNDVIKGAKGVDGRIRTILDAGDGNDRIKGTDAVDTINAGNGNDLVNSIDKAEDTVSCDQGFDVALVDRRDFLRQCELVLGGLPRVAIKGKPELAGNRVALRLKCVATEKCKSVVKLKRHGKLLGKDKTTLGRGKAKTAVVSLNQRGRRVLSDGDRVKVQVVSKDKQGNGWRVAKTVRLG